MTTSNHAYIVGMTDAVREELVGSLKKTGYRVSQTDAHLRVLSQGDRHHNSPDVVVIDVAEMTPSSATDLFAAQKELPGDKVVLVSRRASLALDDKNLPDGAWGLVPKTISARSLQDLMSFMTGQKPTVH